MNTLDLPLEDADPEAHNIMTLHLDRMRNTLNFIAGDNYATPAVLEEVQAPFLDCEGNIGTRHFGGSHLIDEMEKLCQRRALDAFELNTVEWGVNVQPLSGSLANMYAFAALLQPGDTLMGLEMNHGGHISHGYQTTNRKISEMAHKYNCVPYHVDLRTGLIDYDDLEKQANLLRPKLIIAGASAYSRLIDYVRMKKIADDSGALLLADMSHICGLVAAQVVPSPFSHCDIVTTTAYKTLRGPPSAVIFARKHFMKEIDRTVFPRFQCSTNVRHILGMATAFLQARLPESVAQQNMVIACAQILSDGLKRRGYRILGGGTDIHLLVVDLRGTGTDGARVEALLEICRVNTNRNVIPGEKPGSRMGIRFGTAPMVSRGFTMGHFAWFAEIVHRVIGLSVTISRDVEEQASEELTKRTSYQAFLGQMKGGKREESIAELREDVVRKAREYPTPW